MKKIHFLTLQLSLLIFPSILFAQNEINTGLQRVLDLLTGDLATTVALIALTFFGYMLLTGRMDGRWAGSIIVGIIIIFAPANILAIFQG